MPRADVVTARLPRIGPCRDPLELWYLEWRDARGLRRRYFADRAEARVALRDLKGQLTHSQNLATPGSHHHVMSPAPVGEK
jgi:hypothetical protein